MIHHLYLFVPEDSDDGAERSPPIPRGRIQARFTKSGQEDRFARLKEFQERRAKERKEEQRRKKQPFKVGVYKLEEADHIVAKSEKKKKNPPVAPAKIDSRPQRRPAAARALAKSMEQVAKKGVQNRKAPVVKAKIPERRIVSGGNKNVAKKAEVVRKTQTSEAAPTRRSARIRGSGKAVCYMKKEENKPPVKCQGKKSLTSIFGTVKLITHALDTSEKNLPPPKKRRSVLIKTPPRSKMATLEDIVEESEELKEENDEGILTLQCTQFQLYDPKAF